MKPISPNSILTKYEVITASHPEGIGIEIWTGETLLIEIIRNDTIKEKNVYLRSEKIPLNLLEEALNFFKLEIPWDFEN